MGNTRNIVILGSAQDAHARHVSKALELRGCRVFFLNFHDFPTRVGLTLCPSNGDGEIAFPDGCVLQLSAIDAVYWRNYNQVNPEAGRVIVNREHAYIARNDSRSLAEAFLRCVPTRWVNGWDAYILHQQKPYALTLIARLGAKIPRTCLTNVPNSVRKFVADEPTVIFKPVQGGVHTERLAPQMLSDANLSCLNVSPLTFQEEIPGTNIRVFVVGEKVFGIKIATDELDFRDDRNPQLDPVDLPESIQELSRKIAATLHLCWTGIDFRRTPSGDYVFLEANPSPMFMGFEQATGLPLTDALCALLIGS
jgi:glutathione synthase/RimK-type ligase-like ATP-grasp enzyme